MRNGALDSRREADIWSVEHGAIRLSTYLITFRVGDIVDIKANSAEQRGMPHKYYHGYVHFRDLNATGIAQVQM